MTLADRNYKESDEMYRMPQTIKNSRGGFTRDTPKVTYSSIPAASLKPDKASMRFIEQNGVNRGVKKAEKGLSKILKGLW